MPDVVPDLAAAVPVGVLAAPDLVPASVLLALADPDLAAVPDVAVLGAVLADPVLPAALVLGTTLAGEEARTPPVACGLTVLLGTWARKGIIA